MDIDSLINRASAPAGAIGDRAPSEQELQKILTAGMAAPDHGSLAPWRVITVTGDAIARLGDVFAEGLRATNPGADGDSLEKMRRRPMRAPLIVVVVFTPVDDDAVSTRDQLLSAGAVAHQMVLAADALGYGSVWLTGPMAGNPHVADALGLSHDERIVAFVYIGNVSDRAMASKRQSLSRPNPAHVVTDWTGLNEPALTGGRSPTPSPPEAPSRAAP